MPYQGDTTHAPSTPALPAARTVRVIPAVDLFLGAVTFPAGNGTKHFRYPEPRLIAQALAQAVRPTQWCEASATLTVTVAAAGKREGVARHFALCHVEPA
ncbi:hypothetical protein SAMN04487912_101130 [Arthrobacter sp. cf158]|uniref:hypothetical protein n=1 Tax=Arthrobacter sp. cf158 TaxID=1761744 RepID=UPI00089785ED|nr:hypothetical protein [Arthrobacter sp. cf158]SDW01607.1 hypothetical protein SAMN04487912_101130 [Arthrobacter sp. cf158]